VRCCKRAFGKVKLVFHLGHYKTGTSAIQSSLKFNRDCLLEQGVLYPAASGDGNASQHSALVADVMAGRGPQVQATLRLAVEEACDQMCEKIVFSSEGFSSVDRNNAEALHSIASAFGDVEFVIYLRNIYDFALSQAMQLLKNPRRNLNYGILSRRLARMLNYDRILETWCTSGSVPQVFVYEEVGDTALHFLESICGVSGPKGLRIKANQSIPTSIFLALIFADLIRRHEDHEKISRYLSKIDFRAVKDARENQMLLARLIVDAVGFSCDHPLIRQHRNVLTEIPTGNTAKCSDDTLHDLSKAFLALRAF
jgi:hypothetical protein